jgi:hypothetical protein
MKQNSFEFLSQGKIMKTIKRNIGKLTVKRKKMKQTIQPSQHHYHSLIEPLQLSPPTNINHSLIPNTWTFGSVDTDSLSDKIAFLNIGHKDGVVQDQQQTSIPQHYNTYNDLTEIDDKILIAQNMQG